MVENEVTVTGSFGDRDIVRVKVHKNKVELTVSYQYASATTIIDKDNFYKFIDQIHNLKSDQK